MRSLTALAASFGRLPPIIGEVSGPRTGLRPFCLTFATAALADLTAFSTGLRGTLAIVSEVAGTILAAELACPGCLLAVFSEVSRVACIPLLCHGLSLSQCLVTPGRCTRQLWNECISELVAFKYAVTG
jgi:hypothetical protein